MVASDPTPSGLHGRGPHGGPPRDADPRRQGRHDRRRIQRALTASLLAVFLMVLAFFVQGGVDWSGWTVGPREVEGLWGLLAAPLLHGSPGHLAANAIAVLLLGTLAGTVYPRATLRALPLLWLGSGLGAWLLGDPGTHHLGASGVTHGLGFLVFGLGLLRRDRPAIAAAMIAFLFYGGMLLTVLPHEAGVSWQSHLGGAIAGALSAWWFRRADPLPPRAPYSWELEEAAERARAAANDADMLEMPSPDDVPVIWHRPADTGETVLPFRPRRRGED